MGVKWAGLALQLMGILCAGVAAVSTRRRFSDVKFWRSVWAAFSTALHGLSRPSLLDGVDAMKSSGDASIGRESQGVETQIPPLPPGGWRRKVRALYDRDVQAAKEVDVLRKDWSTHAAATKESLADVAELSDARLRELAIGDFYLQVGGLALVALGTVLSTFAPS